MDQENNQARPTTVIPKKLISQHNQGLIQDSKNSLVTSSRVSAEKWQKQLSESLIGKNPLIALSRVSAAISGLGNLDAILKIGLDTTLKVMNCSVGGIMLSNEKNDLLCYKVTYGLSAYFAEEMCIRPGEGIAGRVAKSGKAILVDDISADPTEARADLLKMEGLKAFISVPLKAKENVLGVMNCASAKPRQFNQEDIHLLQSIGDQLGTAVEQAKLYERLRRSREDYRQLTRQLIMVQETERKKISRELHDETSQTLAGLALNLQALIQMAEYIGIQEQRFKEMLQRSHDLTVQIHAEVSRLIADLRPIQIDTLGLVPAIRQYIQSSLAPLGIRVHFSLEADPRHFLPEEELGLFRWVQGAIGNVIKHSEAKNITVSLKHREGKLILAIGDDGKGFDMSGLTAKINERGRGYGLLNMKERITLAGGTCSVESQPGRGTTVTAVVPLPRKEPI